MQAHQPFLVASVIPEVADAFYATHADAARQALVRIQVPADLSRYWGGMLHVLGLGFPVQSSTRMYDIIDAAQARGMTINKVGA